MGAKLIVLAMLAIAIYFFVRALLPPDEGIAQRPVPSLSQSMQQGGEMPLPGASADLSSRAPASIAAPSGVRHDSNAPGSKSKQTAAITESNRPWVTPEPLSEPTETGAAATRAIDDLGATGRLPVPESQIEQIKRVFAPELLRSPVDP